MSKKHWLDEVFKKLWEDEDQQAMRAMIGRPEYQTREEITQEAKDQLKSLLLSEAVDYDLVTHDFGTPQIVAQTKAVPIEAINKLFGDE